MKQIKQRSLETIWESGNEGSFNDWNEKAKRLNETTSFWSETESLLSLKDEDLFN